MKTLFIHMGFAKTGSSALQVFFSSNRELLIEKGILYPEAGKSESSAINHFRAYFCFMEQSHYLCPNDIASPDVEWGRILEVGEKSPTDMLISSEALINLSIEQFDTIKEIVGDKYMIKPIVYIRRVDEYILSLCNQRIKEEDLTSSEIDIETQKINLKMMFEKIKELANIFGQDNIIVRPYEKEQFYNNNIFADFLHYCLNIELTEEFIIPTQNFNIGLGRDTLEFKRIVNGLPITIMQMNSILPGLLKYSVEKKESKPQLCSNKDLIVLINHVKEVEEWISREILKRNDEKIFNNPIPDESEAYQPYEGLELQRTIEISEYILRQILPHESKEQVHVRLMNILKSRISNFEEFNRIMINLELNVLIIKDVINTILDV